MEEEPWRMGVGERGEPGRHLGTWTPIVPGPADGQLPPGAGQQGELQPPALPGALLGTPGAGLSTGSS